MDLEQLVDTARLKAASAADVAALDAVESELTGRSSPIAKARRELGKMPAEERPSFGAKVNEVTENVKAILATRRAELVRLEADRLLQDDKVDVTLEAWTLPAGTEHLIQQTIDEVCEIFIGLGYRVAEGPEAELAWYNFGALNTPPTHPSRLESDTLYLDFGDPADEMLLRTQTSPMQARYMESYEPPVYVVVPGKTYRADAIDASHLPVFHQFEGLAVDASITMSDLKGTLAYFAREFFGSQVVIRLRAHFFPFTEPSAELDVSCFVCGGTGINCRLCQGAGWLEMAGCGMVDPNVFEAVGYDPTAVTGFAFGMGVERLAMVKHGIPNIRHFIDNDIRVLRQFR
jgi:phenylalanyl-tRNA synthetase alpha chain